MGPSATKKSKLADIDWLLIRTRRKKETPDQYKSSLIPVPTQQRHCVWMGGPRLWRKSPPHKRVLSPILRLPTAGRTPLDTRLTDVMKGRGWPNAHGPLGSNQSNRHSRGQEVQIWEQLSSSHLRQRIGEAVLRWRMEGKREVTVTTPMAFNCRGLDISSNPFTSCLGTQCHGAWALTQHLFYLLWDWTHFTVKRGQLGCRGIKNRGKELSRCSTSVAEDRL